MIGKRVDVHFASSPSLFDVEVLSKPCDVGDSWKLMGRDGLAHRVIMFECMSERAPQSAEIAPSASGNKAMVPCLECGRDAVPICDVCHGKLLGAFVNHAQHQ